MLILLLLKTDIPVFDTSGSIKWTGDETGYLKKWKTVFLFSLKASTLSCPNFNNNMISLKSEISVQLSIQQLNLNNSFVSSLYRLVWDRVTVSN